MSRKAGGFSPSISKKHPRKGSPDLSVLNSFLMREEASRRS
jgi:hypothetical protein